MAGSDVIERSANCSAITVGIFVGGRGQRMGGVAKGLLKADDGETIVARQLKTIRNVCADATVVLVGNHDAYSDVKLPQLEDAPIGIGPMGGLRALMLFAHDRGARAVALACDMPSLSEALLLRLLSESPAASVLSPRMEGRWQPLFARYQPATCLPAIDTAIRGGRHSLQVVLDGAQATELMLSAEELTTLRDWDEPSDLPKSHQQT